jgi:hypothetical protein
MVSCVFGVGSLLCNYGLFHGLTHYNNYHWTWRQPEKCSLLWCVILCLLICQRGLPGIWDSEQRRGASHLKYLSSVHSSSLLTPSPFYTFTHSLTHSLTHLLDNYPILIHSLVHWPLAYLLLHSVPTLTGWRPHSFTCPPIGWLPWLLAPSSHGWLLSIH